jgi:hypothetical protein
MRLRLIVPEQLTAKQRELYQQLRGLERPQKSSAPNSRGHRRRAGPHADEA